MNSTNNNLRKILLIVFGIILLAGGGWLLFRAIIFQVISTSPASGSSTTQSNPDVIVTFNKELNSIDQTSQVFSSNNIVTSVTVDKNKLHLHLNNLVLDNTYQIYLRNITAKTNDKIDSYTYTITYSYTPYSQINKSDQEAQLNKTDKGNIDDPAVKALPISTDAYYISYETSDQPDEKGKYVKLSIALLLTDADLQDTQKIHDYKQQAIDYLQAHNINLNDYVVDWAPDIAATTP